MLKGGWEQRGATRMSARARQVSCSSKRARGGEKLGSGLRAGVHLNVAGMRIPLSALSTTTSHTAGVKPLNAPRTWMRESEVESETVRVGKAVRAVRAARRRTTGEE